MRGDIRDDASGPLATVGFDPLLDNARLVCKCARDGNDRLGEDTHDGL